MNKHLHFASILLFAFGSFLSAKEAHAAESHHTGGCSLLVSVPDQALFVVNGGTPVARFPISTSRFGIGDAPGSYATPTGHLEIAEKIGSGAPLGEVFHGRQATGEILKPNAPGRDPIVTRIMWLRGLDAASHHAYDRAIYIHGTPVEQLIGTPASYGCIRMRSCDVVKVFNTVKVGTHLDIVNLPARAILQLPPDNTRVAKGVFFFHGRRNPISSLPMPARHAV